ncbi:calmodulin-binding transcription activator 1 isoform X7 [Cricetulus griseus]|uniref:Calmodulin-binding transcription activator 1 isoform X7 n=1 Tax=Cricetulus griseus TaxID=10029 RepID=A0A9J7GR16_CRIGR|nr:calmodulin-binding transcription activator 1 isoform X7 [Cricetulus griseus]
MWRAEGKWLPKTSRKSVSQSVFCGTSTYCVLNTVPPIEDDHGNSNSSHVKIFLPKKLLECLPKCSGLPKERHRWNTNEEIAAYLITFEKHEEWLTTSPKTRTPCKGQPQETKAQGLRLNSPSSKEAGWQEGEAAGPP